jgi:hypothetical protein
LDDFACLDGCREREDPVVVTALHALLCSLLCPDSDRGRREVGEGDDGCYQLLFAMDRMKP